MRLAALRMMRLLSAFRPRLIGSVPPATPAGAPTSTSTSLPTWNRNVTAILDDHGYEYDVQQIAREVVGVRVVSKPTPGRW
jgi:hypothetical protein